MQRDRGWSSHLLGERPSGHNRGSGPHPLHPVTHQQARRLLGHPLKLGSPSLIGPHPGLPVLQPLQPAHLPKRRLRSAPQPLLASRRTPTTLVDTGLLVDKATDGQWFKWYTTHTPSLPGELDRFCSSSHWKNQTEATSRHCS